MSTDIGALQKQYKTLQQKQHQACVVLSGIGQQNTKSPPNSPDGSGEENDFLKNSMAVMTLSVNMDPEKPRPETTDAVSPMAFGKTKCIFIQNNSKKCQNKQKGRHDKRIRHTKVLEAGDITTEEWNEMNEPNNVEAGADNHDDARPNEIDTVRTNECADTSNAAEPKITISEENIASSKVAGELRESIENGNDQEQDADLDKETYYVTDISKSDQVHIKESSDIGKTESVTTDDSLVDETMNCVNSKMDNTGKPALESKTENPVHFRSDYENMRGQEFYKPFYPLRILKPSKKRHNSVKVTNKQSIYQHFTMTKRQLSLDSALEECYHTHTTNSAVDFPFPVHSINQHKIQAGMKLGLYDQNALEKLETMKPRKQARKRLPSLNVE